MTAPGIEIVLESIITAPSESSSDAVYELGPLDAWLAKTLWVPNAYFYRHSIDASRLKASLSGLLALMPVLSGRVIRLPGPDNTTQRLAIKCVNAGVRVREQALAKSLDDYGGPASFVKRGIGPKEMSEYNEFMDTAEVVDKNAPLMSVILSSLRGGGSVLSVTLAHVVTDGHSVDYVMRSWSNLYNGKPALGVPLFARSVVALPESIPEPEFSDTASARMFELMRSYGSHLQDPGAHPERWPKAVGEAVAQHVAGEAARYPSGRLNREILMVPKAALEVLKAKLQALAETVQGKDALPVSTNDVMLALVWHVIAAVRGQPVPGAAGATAHGTVINAVNIRTKGLGSRDYIGNGVHYGMLMGGPFTKTMAPTECPDEALTDPFQMEAYHGFTSSDSSEAELLPLAATAQRLRLANSVHTSAPALQQFIKIRQGIAKYSPEQRGACSGALVTDATLVNSSWTSFKYDEVCFGGPPLWLDKFATAIPWVVCWLWALSGPPALQTHFVVPTEVVEELRNNPLWGQLPGATWL